MAIPINKMIREFIYDGTGIPLNQAGKRLSKTVIFKSDNVNYAMASVKDGLSITAPYTPVKSGYTFKGWGVSAAATTYVSFPYAPSAETETLHAVWEEES